MFRYFLTSILTILLLFSAGISAEETDAPVVKKSKSFTYEVFFLGNNIGKIHRSEENIDSNYHLRLTAELSFLLLNFSGYQDSKLTWQPTDQWFKTNSFERYSKGFEDIQLTATISDDSHSSAVIMNGKKMEFIETKGKITDLNAMFLEVRQGLLRGQKKFDFYMQTSDEVNHYFFELKGRDKLKTQFGEFKTYRIEQTQVNNRSLSVWYAPELGMQMVRFQYKRKIVNIEGELTSYSIE